MSYVILRRVDDFSWHPLKFCPSLDAAKTAILKKRILLNDHDIFVVVDTLYVSDIAEHIEFAAVIAKGKVIQIKNILYLAIYNTMTPEQVFRFSIQHMDHKNSVYLTTKVIAPMTTLYSYFTESVYGWVRGSIRDWQIAQMLTDTIASSFSNTERVYAMAMMNVCIAILNKENYGQNCSNAIELLSEHHEDAMAKTAKSLVSLEDILLAESIDKHISLV